MRWTLVFVFAIGCGTGNEGGDGGPGEEAADLMTEEPVDLAMAAARDLAKKPPPPDLAVCDKTSCAGGCCAGNQCIDPGTGTQCGTGGVACASCSNVAEGHACVAGVCGCNASTDCAKGTVCDAATHKCIARCDAMSC